MHNATTSVMDNWKQHSLGWHSLDGLATEHGAPLPTQKGNIQGKSCREKTWRTFASIPTDEPQAKQVRIDDAQVCDIPECSGVETRGAQLDDGTLSGEESIVDHVTRHIKKCTIHFVFELGCTMREDNVLPSPEMSDSVESLFADTWADEGTKWKFDKWWNFTNVLKPVALAL